MGSTCDRMGCAAPATVVFGADPIRTVVVMQALDPSVLGNLRPGILCTEHADRLTVPLGWTLDDQRDPTPRLFRIPTAPADDRIDERNDERTGDRTRPTRAAAEPSSFEQPSLVDAGPVDRDRIDDEFDPIDDEIEAIDDEIEAIDDEIEAIEHDTHDEIATVLDERVDVAAAVADEAPTPAVVDTLPVVVEPEPTMPMPMPSSIDPGAPVVAVSTASPAMVEIPMALEWDEREVDVVPEFDDIEDDDIEDDDIEDDDDEGREGPVAIETVTVETVTLETSTLETATVETATVETATVETATVETATVESDDDDDPWDDGSRWGDWTGEVDTGVRELEYVRDPDDGIDVDVDHL